MTSTASPGVHQRPQTKIPLSCQAKEQLLTPAMPGDKKFNSVGQGRASRVTAEVTYATLFSQHLPGNCPADRQSVLLQQSGGLGSLSSALCTPEQGWDVLAFREHRSQNLRASPLLGTVPWGRRQGGLCCLVIWPAISHPH